MREQDPRDDAHSHPDARHGDSRARSRHRPRPARAGSRLRVPAAPGRPGEADRRREVHRRPRLPRRLVRHHHPLDRGAREAARDRAGPRRRLVEGGPRHRGGHPRRERRQPDQGRPAAARAGRWRDPASRRAGRAVGRAGPGDAAPAQGPDQARHRGAPAGVRPGAVGPRVRPVRGFAGRCRRGLRRGRPHPRGRVPGRSPGAAVHREPGDDRGARRGRRHRHPRLDAVPVLHPQGAQAGAGPQLGPGTGHPGGDRRRLWGQGGVPVDAGAPRLAARAQGAAAGADDLRAPRGHRRDDEAAPGDRPPPDRGDEGRPARRPGHRRRDGWRRLLHADPGGAVSRRAPCRRPVSLPERPLARPGDSNEHAAERRLPRLWRAPDRVRGGDAAQSHRRAAPSRQRTSGAGTSTG